MNSQISANQKQTEETFDYKWKKRDTYESEAVQTEWRRWLFEKYFDSDQNELITLLSGGKKRILDAGCGSGGSGERLFGEFINDHEYVGVDISDAVEIAEQRFKERGLSGTFVKADLNNIPPELGQFDIVFSEGVLHHTDSVKDSLAYLTSRLNPSGRFLFYVYVKKAPIREFTDDLIREAISGMSDEDAWKALEPLTQLGKALGELDIEVDVPQDIPYLGISRGKMNLQRLFYYKICKAFYRQEYSVDEMNHCNFDWFRPKNCYRHTPDEVRDFCEHAGLVIERIHVEESGISVIGRRK